MRRVKGGYRRAPPLIGFADETYLAKRDAFAPARLVPVDEERAGCAHPRPVAAPRTACRTGASSNAAPCAPRSDPSPNTLRRVRPTSPRADVPSTGDCTT